MIDLLAILPAAGERGPERALVVTLALAIAAATVSIAASQILLVGAIALAIWLRLHGRLVVPRLGIVPPLVCFFVWTLAAALASAGMREDLTIVKKFVLFLLVVLVPASFRGRGRTLWCYHAVFALAAVSSLAGIVQFAADPERDLLHRITGFMGQWMTYSGLEMLVLVMLVAYGVAYGGRRRWVVPLALVVALALYFSYTRNAWLGAAVGTLVVLGLRRPRAILAAVALLAALAVAAPTSVRDRIRAAWDTEDATTRGRLELLSTSRRLIADNPWLGVGPKSVASEALRYRTSGEFPDWLYQHMHNNLLQIAAERGIPGLLLWLWFMLQLARDASRVLRTIPARGRLDDVEREALVASTAALGAWAALLVAGLFEYNFGDSEVLTLFLFVASAPNAAADAQGSRTAAASARSLEPAP